MPTFIASVGPYGPSATWEAENLDVASAHVHTSFGTLGFRITARHLPPEDGNDPLMPWEGAVLVIRSREPRYGDHAELRISIAEEGQHSYHDQMRRQLQRYAGQEETHAADQEQQ